MGEIHRGGFTLDDTKDMDVKNKWLMRESFTEFQKEMRGKHTKLANDFHGLQMQLGRLEKKFKDHKGLAPIVTDTLPKVEVPTITE